MLKYDYHRAKDITDACKLMKTYGRSARVIAGGTDLLVQFRDSDEKLVGVDHVIDIMGLKELNYIEEKDGYIHLGALTTHTEINESPLIKKHVSFFGEGCGTVGSPQIRNRGTVGGGICNASPASDVVPALIALDSDAVIISGKGERTVPLASIFVKPYVINLEEGEVLKEIRFKLLPEGSKTKFIKIGRRKSLAISRMNVAVSAVVDRDGKVSDIRIAPGGIFPNPMRVAEAEKLLLGKVPTVELIDEASLKVSEEMIKITGIRWSTEYKKPAIEGIVRNALTEVLEVQHG